MAEAKWYIEVYNEEGRFCDIMDIGYDTEDDCKKGIADYLEHEKEWEKKVMDQYEEDMRNFLFDMDTSDLEPMKPVIKTFVYKPMKYVRDERGYTEAD